MYSLGWRKGYEKDLIIGITGISEKVYSWDPEGYKDLQAQVENISHFVGKQFQALSQPLYEEVKSQHKKLHAPVLTPLFNSDPDTFTCHLSYMFEKFCQ
jgi:hypothetical protein